MKKQELILIGRKFGLHNNIVEKILMKKTGLNKSQFFLSEDLKILDLEELKNIFRKVAFGYPIEYILEKAEFYGLDFYVDKRCLIPRNDTEVMADVAILEIKKIWNTDMYSLQNNTIYIDIGTGSGAIPISVVDNIGQYIDKTYAVDISTDALDIAKKNIKTYNFEDKIELIKSDLLSEINLEKNNNYIITANLPYIKNEDFGNMDQEVVLHEPALALYGGKETGFELYEKLIEQILNSPLLYKRGARSELSIILFIEIGFDQKEIAVNYLKNKNLKFEIFKDNGDIERCIKIGF